MLKRLRAILPLIIICFACDKQNDCDVDADFQNKFTSTVNALRKFSEGSNTVGLYEALNAQSYIISLTGTECNMTIGDDVFYEKSQFKKDVIQWEKWYKSNKCSMTLDKADSLIKTRLFIHPELKDDIELG